MRGEASSEGEAADEDEAEAAPTWAPAQGHAANPDWHTVDRALRAIAQRRAALDAEEAGWLRQAEALQIWRPLGMVSALDYLERVLGYAPRTAQDRLRVARALGPLPQLTAALARGELAFSAVRELTRVRPRRPRRRGPPSRSARTSGRSRSSSPTTARAIGPTIHPTPRRAPTSSASSSRPRPSRSCARPAPPSMTSTASTCRDDAFIAALCGTVLDGASTAEPTGRAKFQIAVTVCERCQQGWQHGAGAKLAIRPAAVERALCDAQHLGSLDGDAPERAHQDISPSVARFVWRRDGGRCRLPGCRSARGLELHHVVHRADGGSHDASNLVLACSACHQAHHAGALTISGTADHLEVRRRAELPASAPVTPPPTVSTDAHVGAGTQPSHVATTGAHVGAATQPSHVATTGAHMGATSKLEAAVLRAQTKDALVGLGWKPAIACAAVAAASTAMGPEMTLERLIFEALRQCPGGKRDGRTSPRAP
jgi:HNH endonuclease/RuvA, C-terminal domain